MSYQQIFRPDLDLVYTRFGLSVSLESVRRCAIETFRDPRYRSGMRELIDFRETTVADSRLGFHTINELWESQTTWVRNLRQGGQVVLVATSDLVFGLCRMYASLAEEPNLPMTPCRDWQAACKLLDIDPAFALDAHQAEG